MEGKTCAAVDFYYYLLAFDYYECYCYHYDEVVAAVAAADVAEVAAAADVAAAAVAVAAVVVSMLYGDDIAAVAGDNVAAGWDCYCYWPIHQLPLRCSNAGDSGHQPRNRNHWNPRRRAKTQNPIRYYKIPFCIYFNHLPACYTDVSRTFRGVRRNPPGTSARGSHTQSPRTRIDRCYQWHDWDLKKTKVY